MLAYVHANQQWPATLTLLRKSKTLKDVNQIHSRLITTGLIRNPSLTTRIILEFCASSHPPLLQFARYVFFSQNPNPTCTFQWNAIIRSFSHGPHPKQAIALLSFMLENGVFADRFSCSLVLKACSRLCLIREGLQIHCLIGKIELGSDVLLQNCLICLYSRCGSVEFARRVFDRMPERDSVSWNSVIDGYVKRGMMDVARELFDRMASEERNVITWNSMISGFVQSEEGIEIARDMFDRMPERDLVSWNSMINGYAKWGRLETAQNLFDQMPEQDFVTWASMIDGYVKIGSVDLARSLFDEMPKRDVITWNVMMGGYVRNGREAEALQLFHEMRFDGSLSPDQATLVVVLSAIAELGWIDDGILIHKYIERKQFSLDGNLGVALIDMYSKCGNIDNAIQVFKNLRQRSIDHWNVMIGGLAIHGLGELALHLFAEMERLSYKPDDITFIGLLNACGHAGLVKEGLMCFELMKTAYDMKPKVQHYGCVVDILGRAGRLKEARKLIEEMPIEPNDVIWRALLSACRDHNNFDIGQEVAEQLIELDSHNSSSYVLLSNLYAGYGMWDDVSQIRMVMKAKEIQKIPGCSWIELDGIVHEFVVGDKSHPKSKEIYSMLDNMCSFKL